LLSIAAGHEPIAWLILGNRYLYGQGVDKDMQQANAWYRKAAEAGSARAMFRLGVNHQHGPGVENSWEEVRRWFLQAAELGNKEAEFRAHHQWMTFPKRKYKAKTGRIGFYRTSGTVLDSKRSSKTISAVRAVAGMSVRMAAACRRLRFAARW